MLKDYTVVALQAHLWSIDAKLSPRKRLLAKHLSELARILADPRYGCPAEHDAAELMYCSLCKSLTPGPADPVCPRRAGCPRRDATSPPSPSSSPSSPPVPPDAGAAH